MFCGLLSGAFAQYYVLVLHGVALGLLLFTVMKRFSPKPHLGPLLDKPKSEKAMKPQESRSQQTAFTATAVCAMAPNVNSLRTAGRTESFYLQQGRLHASMQVSATPLLIPKRPATKHSLLSSFYTRRPPHQQEPSPFGSSRTAESLNTSEVKGHGLSSPKWTRKQEVWANHSGENTADEADCGNFNIDHCSCGADQDVTLMRLRKSLKLEREALRSVYTELEEERLAAETAVNEAMGKILCLQEEKAALQLESAHYRRIAEEKAVHDEQAIHVLREKLVRKESENMALLNQLNRIKRAYCALRREQA